MKTLVYTAAFATCFASSAFAETFKCDFSRGGAGGWIRPIIMVKVDPDAGAAWVEDDITNSISKGWYEAKLATDNDKRYTVKWTVDRLKDASGQNVKADYRVTVTKSSLKGSASMLPQGYDNTFQTVGKCQRS